MVLILIPYGLYKCIGMKRIYGNTIKYKRCHSKSTYKCYQAWVKKPILPIKYPLFISSIYKGIPRFFHRIMVCKLFGKLSTLITHSYLQSMKAYFVFSIKLWVCKISLGSYPHLKNMPCHEKRNCKRSGFCTHFTCIYYIHNLQTTYTKRKGGSFFLSKKQSKERNIHTWRLAQASFGWGFHGEHSDSQSTLR